MRPYSIDFVTQFGAVGPSWEHSVLHSALRSTLHSALHSSMHSALHSALHSTLRSALLCTLAALPVLRFCSACCSALCSAMFLRNIALPSALHSALHWALRFCSEQASTLSLNALRARAAREQGLHVIRQTCCVAARPARAVLALRLLPVQGTQLKVPSCFRLVLSVLCCFFCCSRCFCVACNA